MPSQAGGVSASLLRRVMGRCVMLKGHDFQLSSEEAPARHRQQDEDFH